MFLLWPLLLAVVMVNTYWGNLPTVLAYITIVLVVCLTTATVALFCSVFFQKTSIALMTTYLIIVVLFAAPLAITFFANTFFYDTAAAEFIRDASFSSPFAAAFNLPIDLMMTSTTPVTANWPFFASFMVFYVALERRAAGHNGLDVQRPLANGLSGQAMRFGDGSCATAGLSSSAA